MRYPARSERPPLRITLGSACLDTRLRLDLTQQQVADRVGITRGYLAKIEAGSANPPLRLIEAIADAVVSNSIS